jgi:hypothetical protein
MFPHVRPHIQEGGPLSLGKSSEGRGYFSSSVLNAVEGIRFLAVSWQLVGYEQRHCDQQRHGKAPVA